MLTDERFPEQAYSTSGTTQVVHVTWNVTTWDILQKARKAGREAVDQYGEAMRRLADS